MVVENSQGQVGGVVQGEQEVAENGPEGVSTEQDSPEIAAEEPEKPEITAEDIDFVSEHLQKKAIGKVEELAERLGEVCRDGGQEIEATRNFVQDLQGRYSGWRLIVDVKMTVRKTPT